MQRALLCIVALAAFAGVTPALAQKCVAQGDGRYEKWTDCGGGSSSSSGSRTITVWIEQPPEIILGPPQIVWVRPTAAGSTQSTMLVIDNPTLKRELANNAVTGWQLHNKGLNALKAGDINKALAYCNEALKRRNSADEASEIQAACDRIHKQANSESGLPVPKFEKSVRTTMQIEVDQVEKWFETTDPKYESVRKDLMPLLLARSNAREQASAAEVEITKAKTSGNSAALEAANTAMAKATTEKKKAEKAVLDKNQEAEITFRLVKSEDKK